VTEVLRGLVRSLDTKGTQKDLQKAYKYSRLIDDAEVLSMRLKQATLASDKVRLFYLSNVASNINQIARWANAYKSDADATKVVAALKEAIKHQDYFKKGVPELIIQHDLEERQIMKGRVEDVYHEVFESGKLTKAD
jgi:type II secretory pathway component GspD/PulD (secretin)